MQCHAADQVQQKEPVSLPLHLHPAYTSIPFYSSEDQAYGKQNKTSECIRNSIYNQLNTYSKNLSRATRRHSRAQQPNPEQVFQQTHTFQRLTDMGIRL